MKNVFVSFWFAPCLVACGGSVIPGMDASQRCDDASHNEDATPAPDAQATDAAPAVAHALMVARFEAQDRLLVAEDAWNSVGTLDVSVYGSELPLTRVTFNVPGTDAIDGIALAQNGAIVTSVTGILGTYTPYVTAPFDAPRLIQQGEHVRYDVWVRVNQTGRDLTQIFRTASVAVYEVTAMPPVNVTVEYEVPFSQAYLRLCATAPVLNHQPLPTHVLANGLEQDLYRANITSRATGTIPVKVGSLSFMLDGLTSGRSLGQFRVHVGTTPLAPGDYRVVNARTFADLTIGTLTQSSLGGYSSMVTVIFPNGRTFIGSGETITVSATPSGFQRGDELTMTTNFFDFSSPLEFRWAGTFVPEEGTIDMFNGRTHTHYIDPIVWTDGNVSGSYTGAYQIEHLDRIETLTAL